jgi:type I restriction enzyme S subunit
LRKAGVVDFEGICSDVSYVCRTRDENVLMQRFLPFIFQTDAFWKFAEENKGGSTNFFLNWSDFERYEFDLPSIEEQRQLTEILWAAQNAKLAYKELLRQTDELVKSQFIELFGDYVNQPIRWDCRKLQELIELGWITYHLDGNHGGDYPRSEEFVKNGVSYISANCIVDGRIDFTNAKYVTEERSKRFRKGIAQNRDVLFAHNATVGPVAILETQDPIVILGTSLTAFRCNTEKLLPEYLKTYLECD